VRFSGPLSQILFLFTVNIAYVHQGKHGYYCVCYFSLHLYEPQLGSEAVKQLILPSTAKWSLYHKPVKVTSIRRAIKAKLRTTLLALEGWAGDNLSFLFIICLMVLAQVRQKITKN
jgi:hypothetical protein